MELRRHERITPQLLRKKYLYTEWHVCSCGYIKLPELKEGKVIIIDLEDHELVKVEGKSKTSLKVEARVKRLLNKKAKVRNTDPNSKYNKYINSKEWKEVKRKYFEKHDKECVRCYSTDDIHLHHIVYKNLGKEKDKDLAPICKKCHLAFHKVYKHNDRNGFNQFIVNES